MKSKRLVLLFLLLLIFAAGCAPSSSFSFAPFPLLSSGCEESPFQEAWQEQGILDGIPQ